MAKIGAFDPNLGVNPLADGHREIGRANLPVGSGFIPGPVVESGDEPIYGKMTNSTLMENFSTYFAFEPAHRELLAPDAFFSSLGRAAGVLQSEAFESGSGASVAARLLLRVLDDRALCETLRALVLKA